MQQVSTTWLPRHESKALHPWHRRSTRRELRDGGCAGRREGQPLGLRHSDSRPVPGTVHTPVRLGRTPSTEVRHMSVVVRFKPTGLTREQYDESVKRLEEAGLWPDPDGMHIHVLFGDDGDLHVSEIWDSREKLVAFGDQ